jgi:hypothetical protein
MGTAFHATRGYTDMVWVLAQKQVALAGVQLGAILEADLSDTSGRVNQIPERRIASVNLEGEYH